MPKRTEAYDSWQLEKLSDPEIAATFLNAALEDSSEMFLIALRKVAQARQMAKVAKEANIQRETLYHALSGEGNPTLQTLSSVLGVLGLKISISESTHPSPSPRARNAELTNPTQSAGINSFNFQSDAATWSLDTPQAAGNQEDEGNIPGAMIASGFISENAAMEKAA